LLMLEKFSHLNQNVIATNVKTSVFRTIFVKEEKPWVWDEISRNRVLYQLVCNLGMRMYVGKSFEKSVFLWKGFDSTQIEWEPLEFCILNSLSCSGHFCLGYIWVASIESAVSTKINS
jgi:hypothetical protein